MKRYSVVFVLVAVALAGCGGGGGGGGTPAAPTTLSIATLSGSGTLAANATYPLSVTESGGGQTFPPGALTYTLSNPAVGTLSGGILTTGLVNATGQITVTDASRGLSSTITVRVGTTHPATNGDAVTLTGTLTERITRPLPAPVATQPPYGFSYAVSIASTTSTGKTFGTQTGLIDFTTVETDMGSTPPLPVTTTDTYESLVRETTGTVDVVSPGSFASDTNGSTYRTVNGNGNGLIDILPETNGRTWRNSAYRNYVETEPDTTRIVRATSPSGAYTETDTFADTTQPTATIAVAANLSGTYTDASIPGFPGLYDFTFGAPVRSGGDLVIPLTIESEGTSTAGAIKDWYPSTSPYSESSELLTAQAIPSACDVPAALGSTANEVSERITRLDPALGTYESRHDVTYLVPFYGTACTTFSDVLDDYYDYSGQATQPFSSTPQQITTLVETLGFKSGAIAGASTTRRAATSVAARNDTAAEIGQVAATVGRANFDRAIGRLYRERSIALHAFLRKHTATLRIGR